MCAMASQITSVSIVYSTACSGTDQRKHQSSASLAFVGGIHQGPVNSPHKRPEMRKIMNGNRINFERNMYYFVVSTLIAIPVKLPWIFAGAPLVFNGVPGNTWWRHQMETFSALLALCAGNSPVPVTSPHKGQWRGSVMFSLIYAWINDWINNREAGDLRRHRGHYDVIVMIQGNLDGYGLLMAWPRHLPGHLQWWRPGGLGVYAEYR